MTREECERNHDGELVRDELVQRQQTKDMAELKKSIQVLFKMNRALVTYSDIPDHEKTQILNASGNGG